MQTTSHDDVLRGRDPAFIRRTLPLWAAVLPRYFRADVRGLENIPASGPVLLVGNHSGGNVPPDTFLFTLAFISRFGLERPFYQLAHDLVMASPVAPLLRRYGSIPASRSNAAAALAGGAVVLVYPGGDHETHRPSWRSSQVDFDRRVEQSIPVRADITEAPAFGFEILDVQVRPARIPVVGPGCPFGGPSPTPER